MSVERWNYFLEKPADPIILGTSPVNYRVDSSTLSNLWTLNSVPTLHSESRLLPPAV